jgi:hypothetical protein
VYVYVHDVGVIRGVGSGKTYSMYGKGWEDGLSTDSTLQGSGPVQLSSSTISNAAAPSSSSSSSSAVSGDPAAGTDGTTPPGEDDAAVDPSVTPTDGMPLADGPHASTPVPIPVNIRDDDLGIVPRSVFEMFDVLEKKAAEVSARTLEESRRI